MEEAPSRPKPSDVGNGGGIKKNPAAVDKTGRGERSSQPTRNQPTGTKCSRYHTLLSRGKIMENVTGTKSFETFAAEHQIAMFAMRAGTKTPMVRWTKEWTRDPAAIAALRASGCNLGINLAETGWIGLDIDSSRVGRDAAWAAAHRFCTEQLGLPCVPAHYCDTARGGWHIAFARPAGIDPKMLKGNQAGVVKDESGHEIIGIKNRGLFVAPGSVFNGNAYQFNADTAAVHPCPPKLLKYLERPVIEISATAAGTSDPVDLMAVCQFLADHDEFEDEPDWFRALGAIKLACGDDGLEAAREITWATVSEEQFLAKWNRLSATPQKGNCTIATLIWRANEIAKSKGIDRRFGVRRSGDAMFGGVTAPPGLPPMMSSPSIQVDMIAARAGASLSTTGGPAAMLGRGAQQAEAWLPILTDFLKATADVQVPAIDVPAIPENIERVRPELCQAFAVAIPRLLVMPNPTRALDVFAVLHAISETTADAVMRLVNFAGGKLNVSKTKKRALALLEDVEHAATPPDGYVRDGYKIENDNPDNVRHFLGIVGVEVRFNSWLDRIEICGWQWPEWTPMSDPIRATLLTRAARTKSDFRPNPGFFEQTILAIAWENRVDPALEMLDNLESGWDGLPRLWMWLSSTCGVPADAYHQAVGANVIGGMVRRVRQPGCKHDTMAIFCGYQGASKSKLARFLCPNEDWFTEGVKLGDDSKELILSLAGIAVAEISEMGSRGSIEDVKAMLSKQSDRGRPAYARNVVDRPRRNIFIGSSNDTRPLLDPTGNRRFLPIMVAHEIDLEWLRANITQLVGEACHLERAGSDFNLPREVWGIAAEHQEAARGESDADTILEDWFAVSPVTENAFITGGDLSRLATLAGMKNNKERGLAMQKLGFKRCYETVLGKQARVWVRGTYSDKGCVRYLVDDQHKFPSVNIRPAAVGDVVSGGAQPPLPPQQP